MFQAQSSGFSATGVHYRLCLDLDSSGALWAGDTALEAMLVADCHERLRGPRGRSMPLASYL